jgi:hypothetical protein
MPRTGAPGDGAPGAGEPEDGEPKAGKSEVGALDAGAPEVGEPDAGAPEVGAPEVGEPDGDASEVGAPEVGAPEAGAPEVGAPEVGAPDAGAPEIGEPESGAPDEGAPWAGATDVGPITGCFEVGTDAHPVACRRASAPGPVWPRPRRPGALGPCAPGSDALEPGLLGPCAFGPGVLGPGVLRPGVLRPGVLRPGEWGAVGWSVGWDALAAGNPGIPDRPFMSSRPFSSRGSAGTEPAAGSPGVGASTVEGGPSGVFGRPFAPGAAWPLVPVRESPAVVRPPNRKRPLRPVSPKPPNAPVSRSHGFRRRDSTCRSVLPADSDAPDLSDSLAVDSASASGVGASLRPLGPPDSFDSLDLPGSLGPLCPPGPLEEPRRAAGPDPGCPAEPLRPGAPDDLSERRCPGRPEPGAPAGPGGLGPSGPGAPPPGPCADAYGVRAVPGPSGTEPSGPARSPAGGTSPFSAVGRREPSATISVSPWRVSPDWVTWGVAGSTAAGSSSGSRCTGQKRPRPRAGRLLSELDVGSMGFDSRRRSSATGTRASRVGRVWAPLGRARRLTTVPSPASRHIPRARIVGRVRLGGGRGGQSDLWQ